MNTTIEQLDQWLGQAEGENLEFKKAKDSYPESKLIRYCCALANERGGKMILGVDDATRQVCGTNAYQHLQGVSHRLLEALHLRVDAEEIRHPLGRVLVFHVPSRPIGRPIIFEGASWMRSGESLVEITPDQLQRIFAESCPDFSAELCKAASLEDLDPSAVGDFRAKWAEHSRNDRLFGVSVGQLLEDAELMVDGNLTYAALILFGTKRALGRHLAQSEIVFEYKPSFAAGPAQQRENFREGFFCCYSRLWELVNLRNDKQHYSEGLFVYDIPTFDERTIREALLNAVSHRDYRLGGSIFIRQFPQTLEIVSPGGLPEGITPENIIDRQNPRNRRIAETFEKCNMVERSGQGMNLIFERLIEQSKPLPDFRNTDSYQVSIALSGQVRDPLFIRFLEKVAEERNALFGTHDLILLDKVHSEAKIEPTDKERLNQLVEQGVLERSGSGRGVRYMLSLRFYEMAGRKAQHTRKSGLDRSTNIELIHKHIRSCGALGAPMREIREVVPSLTYDTVRGLAQSLKAEGKIEARGHGGAARWFAIEGTE
ncbi:MAG: transcriptional regulator [Lentisphaerae bacterium]|nr:transcriptional regulator [Lentisphaerota bacterium]